MTTTSLSTLLETLTDSLSAALEATPRLASAEVPEHGLSLLHVKNELLLSYLQHLVFFILLKLRQAKDATPRNSDRLVVRKLVELRLYLEKGIRPLEDKLRYQIETVLRAADDVERKSKAAHAEDSITGKLAGQRSCPASESDREEASVVDAEEDVGQAKLSDLQYRPNLAAFQRPRGSKEGGSEEDRSGLYRPPRVAPTVMPTTERREKTERKNLRSATLDEYIADELSAAPVAQPSIGTNIVRFGRSVKTAADRAKEDERREYEERNFVRLPKESRKDRAKNAKMEGDSRRIKFGGEEWRDISDGVDRINRLTSAKTAATGTGALLEKSRKRGRETVDGRRGSGSTQGTVMGERYQKRLKLLESGRRDRGKKR